MTKSPIPILLIFLLLRNRGGFHPPVITALELESTLDNVRSLLNTLDKVNGFAQSGIASSLPDMKKMMEIVEKLPL